MVHVLNYILVALLVVLGSSNSQSADVLVASSSHDNEQKSTKLVHGKTKRQLKIDQLEKAKVLCQELADLIYNRYELFSTTGSFFFLSSNLAEDAYKVYKWKFAKKIMENNPSYLMIFGGSSVTAGIYFYLSAYIELFNNI